jgi:hypothetical protein
MRKGKNRRKFAAGNEEAGQTNTRKEEKLDGTSTEDDIRKSSQESFVLSTDRKT